MSKNLHTFFLIIFISNICRSCIISVFCDFQQLANKAQTMAMALKLETLIY
jgi:hypothetical protein